MQSNQIKTKSKKKKAQNKQTKTKQKKRGHRNSGLLRGRIFLPWVSSSHMTCCAPGRTSATTEPNCTQLTPCTRLGKKQPCHKHTQAHTFLHTDTDTDTHTHTHTQKRQDDRRHTTQLIHPITDISHRIRSILNPHSPYQHQRFFLLVGPCRLGR